MWNAIENAYKNVASSNTSAQIVGRLVGGPSCDRRGIVEVVIAAQLDDRAADKRCRRLGILRPRKPNFHVSAPFPRRTLPHLALELLHHREGQVCDCNSQSSTRSPGTFAKSVRLRESKMAPFDMTMLAILRSMVPMRILCARRPRKSAAAASSQGKTVPAAKYSMRDCNLL